MSRRKLNNGPYDYNDDEDYVPTKKIQYSSRDTNPIHNKKHTLDSDEEDEDTKAEAKNYDVLKDEDIDGQEDATIDYEGETKITPFNMKEELEEGHFDKDGFYHFKKDSDQLKDAWLDNIDWIKVKHQVDGIKNYGSDEDSLDSNHVKSKEEIDKEQKEEFVLYNEIFPYLHPQETVAMALKRLGGGKKKRLTTAERWKLKKQGKLVEDSGNNMETFMTVTDIANRIVDTGNIDVYEETYEMINMKMKRYEASQPKVLSDPSFDMFAEETSSKSEGVCPTTDAKEDSTVAMEESSDKESQKETSTLEAKIGSSDTDDKPKEDSEPVSDVRWEYRWEESDEAEIHGPYSSEQMVKWKESDFFKSGVFVRKVTERTGPWYKSSRIDFELYT